MPGFLSISCSPPPLPLRRPLPIDDVYIVERAVATHSLSALALGYVGLRARMRTHRVSRFSYTVEEVLLVRAQQRHASSLNEA